MLEFPKSIPNPDYPFNVIPEDNSIMSTFEDGSVQSRRKFTRSRDTFEITWSSMKHTDYEVLMDFIKNKAHFKAVTFKWVNPQDGNSRVVRCVNVSTITNIKLNYWTVKLKLQEV